MDRSRQDFHRQGQSSSGGQGGRGYHDGNRGRGDNSFSSGSSHYNQRGRGDSRGRGYDNNRGGAGGQGGFPSQVTVASTKPGQQARLVSNHFKITIRNKGMIHIYQVDFGTLEAQYHMSAIRSGSDAIRAHVNHFIPCPRNNTVWIFAMQQSEESEFTIPCAANGQQCEMAIKHLSTFNLDQTQQMKGDIAERVL